MTNIDPRARLLAQHRQRIAHEPYGSTARWSNLQPDEQQLFVEEAATWLRAATEAGIVPAADHTSAVRPPAPDRVTAIYDAIDAFQRTHRTGGGLQHAQIRALLAEHLAHTLPAADRAAVLEEAAQVADELSMQVEQDMKRREVGPLTALQDLADELRRMAAEAQDAPPREPHPTEADLLHARAVLDRFKGRDTATQICDGCGHPHHPAHECPVTLYGERCTCDEPISAEQAATPEVAE